VLNTQEHIDLVAQFERDVGPGRLDKEPKETWSRCRIYQDGRVNEQFLVYRFGYAYGKAIGRGEATNG